jgi:serine/threonine protein kinase
MREPALNAAAHCINPDCQRPVIRSLAARICPTCKTTLRLNDRYIPLEQLSTNRHTATYRVYDLHAKAEAVLKVLIETQPQAVNAFHYTNKVLSSMRCPGLPRVAVKSYFVIPIGGAVPSLPCFVMEKIAGKSLQSVIAEYPGGCPDGWVMTWLEQMVETLKFLHSRQLIHGNLTPDNVFLRDETDQVVLIGFGNSKYLTGQPALVGEHRSRSQAYKPTEQITGMEINEAADLFAVGQICIHLLTGIHPLELEDKRTGRLRWRQRIRVNSKFADVLDKLTHPNPDQRAKTAIEVKAMVAKISAKKENVKPKPQAVRSKAPKFTRRTSAHPVTVMQDVRPAAIQFPTIAQFVISCIQVMINVALTSTIATLIGFWLIFYSPLRGWLDQLFATLSTLPSTLLSPVLLLFMIAGVGTSWGMMHLRKSVHARHFWFMTGLAGIGYGLSWISWQQASEQPIQALAQITAIAAIFLTFDLFSLPYLLIHLPITGLGTLLTMLVLLRSQFLPVDILYALFPITSSVPLLPSTELLIACVKFFASLGIVACFWAIVSQLLVTLLHKAK